MGKLKREEMQIGTNVYKILEKLGSGGNGDVMKAKCGNKHFAIKFLKKEIAQGTKKKQIL